MSIWLVNNEQPSVKMQLAGGGGSGWRRTLTCTQSTLMDVCLLIVVIQLNNSSSLLYRTLHKHMKQTLFPDDTYSLSAAGR